MRELKIRRFGIFLNESSIEDKWRRKQMSFLDIASRIKSSMHPKMLLTSTFDSKRSRGRKIRAVRYDMVENVNPTVPIIGKDGQIYRWTKHAKKMSN